MASVLARVWRRARTAWWPLAWSPRPRRPRPRRALRQWAFPDPQMAPAVPGRRRRPARRSRAAGRRHRRRRLEQTVSVAPRPLPAGRASAPRWFQPDPHSRRDAPALSDAAPPAGLLPLRGDARAARWRVPAPAAVSSPDVRRGNFPAVPWQADGTAPGGVRGGARQRARRGVRGLAREPLARPLLRRPVGGRPRPAPPFPLPHPRRQCPSLFVRPAHWPRLAVAAAAVLRFDPAGPLADGRPVPAVSTLAAWPRAASHMPNPDRRVGSCRRRWRARHGSAAPPSRLDNRRAHGRNDWSARRRLRVMRPSQPSRSRP